MMCIGNSVILVAIQARINMIETTSPIPLCLEYLHNLEP